jgi:type VI secretion system protein ImpL
LKEALKESISKSDYRYFLPWYLVLGSENSGSTSLFKMTKLKKLAVNPLEETYTSKSANNWWVLDKAVIINPAGKLDEDPAKPRLWKYYVKQLRKYHRLRPLDGIVITISLEDLLLRGREQATELNKLKTIADQCYSKIVSIQKYLKMHLPVYVVVTKCDQLTGFEDFTKRIPGELDQNIFGWSNPYKSTVYSYSKNWIIEAFQKISLQFTYIMFGLSLDDMNETEFNRIYSLKNELESLKYPLQLFINRVFATSQNPYLASLIFMGIYFVGARTASGEDIEASEKVFLNDLIEKKIIRETGLAKPSRKIIVY